MYFLTVSDKVCNNTHREGVFVQGTLEGVSVQGTLRQLMLPQEMLFIALLQLQLPFELPLPVTRNVHA